MGSDTVPALQEQKQKQREKEYERKRDQKARDRQLYYMRHTHDYATLELPVGASRADVKAAYRKLAKVCPGNHTLNQDLQSDSVPISRDITTAKR